MVALLIACKRNHNLKDDKIDILVSQNALVILKKKLTKLLKIFLYE
jgi:hypothetical protein